MKILYRYICINPKIRSVVFILLFILAGIITGQLVGYITSSSLLDSIEGSSDQHIPPDFELTDDQKQAIITGYVNASMILCVEISLLIGLIIVFVRTYLQTHSRYLIGFILFVGVLFAKSISYFFAMAPLFTDPIRQAPIAITPLMKGFFGPFGIYFTFFEIIAISILIYLSRE